MTETIRRRTTLRLPVPTGADRKSFAYHQLRWLYQATRQVMDGGDQPGDAPDVRLPVVLPGLIPVLVMVP